jgi:hypothetical protein
MSTTAGVEVAINEMKHQAEENSNAPPAQIMCVALGEVQKEEFIHNITERNAFKRSVSRMKIKN